MTSSGVSRLPESVLKIGNFQEQLEIVIVCEVNLGMFRFQDQLWNCLFFLFLFSTSSDFIHIPNSALKLPSVQESALKFMHFSGLLYIFFFLTSLRVAIFLGQLYHYPLSSTSFENIHFKDLFWKSSIFKHQFWLSSTFNEPILKTYTFKNLFWKSSIFKHQLCKCPLSITYSENHPFSITYSENHTLSMN